MAEAALDEHGEERLAKLRHVAEKKQRRMKERGQSETADIDAMRRALCAYYVDATSAKMRGIKKVFAAEGASIVDFFGGARDRYAELRLVFEFIQRTIQDLAEAEAAETACIAQASQSRLLTEEDCKLNQRAVEVSLKATMRKVYGDSTEVGGGGGRDRAGITYMFPNMTLNWIMAPNAPAAARSAVPEKVVAEAIEAEVSDGA
jgi:hypothetical protein